MVRKHKQINNHLLTLLNKQIMKKVIFLAIAAAAALTACSKSEVIDSKYGNDMIGFETYLGRDAQTKGAVADVATVQANAFGVFGFYTGTQEYAAATPANLMNDTVVSYDAEKGWTYTPVKYWTNATDKYTFLAYSPATLTATQDENVAPTFNYTVPAALANQIDVLYSNDNKNVVKSEKVNFTFHHALSRITVKANAEMYDKDGNIVTAEPADGYDNTFTITSLVLDGPFNTTGKFDLNAGTWALTAGTASYSFFTGSQALTAESYDFAGTNNYLMALPTDFSAKSGEGEEAAFTKTATLIVKYTVTYAGSTSAENTATVAINTNFEQGKAYSINIKLMRDPDNAITFDVIAVDEWSEENINNNVEA